MLWQTIGVLESNERNVNLKVWIEEGQRYPLLQHCWIRKACCRWTIWRTPPRNLRGIPFHPPWFGTLPLSAFRPCSLEVPVHRVSWRHQRKTVCDGQRLGSTDPHRLELSGQTASPLMRMLSVNEIYKLKGRVNLNRLSVKGETWDETFPQGSLWFVDLNSNSRILNIRILCFTALFRTANP